MYNPMLNQQMAQLDQEYAQKKANIMQNFYSQQQGGNWGQQGASVQSTQQLQSQNVEWIYVSGIEGAKNQIVQQGCTAWMMDNNQPYFYVKSVNKIGSPEFHAFFFREVSEAELNQQMSQPAQPQIDPSRYVQRDEFDQLKAQFEQLTTVQKKQPVKANKEATDNG